MKVCLVIMAAGMSSRFRGYPKQLVKIGPHGETLIEYSVKQAFSIPLSQIHFIVGDKTEVFMKQIFKNNYCGVPITYSKQTYDKKKRNKPWGTADALATIKGHVNGPFIICNGDDIYGELTFQQCCLHMHETADNVLMGYWLGDTLPHTGKVNRGIVSTDQFGFITDIKESYGMSRHFLSPLDLNNTVVSMNIFGFRPYIIDMVAKKVSEFKLKYKDHPTKECPLPTVIDELIKEHFMPKAVIYGCCNYNAGLAIKVLMAKGQWMGITNPGDEVIVRETILNKMT